MNTIATDYIGPRHAGLMQIVGVRAPTNNDDVATKRYVDTHSGGGSADILGTVPIIITTAPSSTGTTATISIDHADGTTPGYIAGDTNVLGGDFTFTGDMNISGDALVINPTSMTLAGNSTVTGDLTITGDMIISGDSLVINPTSMTLAGNNTIAGDLTITGDMIVSGDSLVINPTTAMTLAGNSTVTGDLTISGSAIRIANTAAMTLGCNSTVTGNTTVAGNTVFLGDVNFSGGDYTVGASSTLAMNAPTTIAGDQTVTGDVHFRGDVYMTGTGAGSDVNITNDHLSINGTSGTFVVSQDSTVTIAGDSTVSGDVRISGDITMAGTTYVTGSLNVPTASIGSDSTIAANTEFVQDAINIANYEASNGWIAGGRIFQCNTSGADLGTNPSTNFCFSVETVVVRWTDYTDPLHPIASVPETISGFGVFTVPLASQTFTNAGIYVSKSAVVSNLLPASSKISAEFGVPTNITKLYGEYIQLGAILMQDNGIIACANPKLLPAYQNNLMNIDFLTLITPCNLGRMAISAGGATDNSIVCSGGVLWQAQANRLNSPTNPSRITVPVKPASQPVYPLYQMTTGAISTDIGVYQPTDTSWLATTLWNNVGVEDLVTTAASITAWVNSPILFNSSLNLYTQQLPTETFATEADAISGLGRFTRITGLNNETSLLNLIGYVTYQVNCTDLSAASFAGGEFFNYGVGGGVGGGAGGGGGGSGIVSLSEKNTAFVEQSPIGSDLTGVVGRYDLPFVTVSAALAAITFTVDTTSPGHVHMAAGYHQDTSAVCPSFISLAGWGLGSTQLKLISGLDSKNITANPNVATLTDGRISLRNIRLVDGTGIRLELAEMPGAHEIGAGMLFDLYDSEVEGRSTFTARRATSTTVGYSTNDKVRLICVENYEDLTFTGGNIILNNVFQHAGSTLNTLTIRANECNAEVLILGCLFENIEVIATGAATAIVKVSSSVINGSILVNGASASLIIDKASISTINPVVTNGATVSIYDEDELQTNIIWISEAGSDTGYFRDGKVLNRAVKTLPAAVNLCTGATVGNEKTIICFDPMISTDAATIPAYVSLDAPVMNITGALTLKGNQVIRAKYISGNITMDGATFCNVKCDEFGSGGNFMATHGTTYFEAGRIMGTSSTDPVIQTYNGADIIIRSSYIQGLVVSTGYGSSVDVTQVADINSAYWNIDLVGEASVKFPAHYMPYAVESTGPRILTLVGTIGRIAIATPGVDYILGDQNLTLGTDITATGALTGTISATISSNAVKYGQIQTIAAQSVIGNPATVTANSTSVAFSSAATASTLMLRDPYASVKYLHGTESFEKITKTGSIILASTHSGLIEFVGTDTCICQMPNASEPGIAESYKFLLSNGGSSGTVSVTTRSGTPITDILPLSCITIILTNSLWEVIPTNNSISLTGDVLGTWAGSSIATTINTGVVGLSSLSTIPSYTVLGNLATESAAVTAVAADWNRSYDGILTRDNGNTYTYHLTEGYEDIEALAGGMAIYYDGPARLRVYGSNGRTPNLVLPVLTTTAATDVFAGWEVTIYNDNNATISVDNHLLAQLAVIPVKGEYTFIAQSSGSWISYPTYPSISLTGGASGSAVGSSVMSIPVTVATGTSILGSIPAYAFIGNTSSAGIPGTVPATSTALASSLVLRDTSGSAEFNHATCSFTTLAASSTTCGLATTGPSHLVITGATTQLVTLPIQSTATPSGYIFRVYNTSTGTCTVQNSASVTQASLTTGMTGEFMSLGTASNSGWLVTTNGGGASFTTTQVFDISANAKSYVICGSCITTASEWITLCSLAPSALISGTSSSLSVMYNIDVVHISTGAYGQMTGSYRGYYTTGSPGTFAVTTPFTSDIKSLDATLSTCAVQCINSGGSMLLQVWGPGAFSVKYAGQINVVQRGLAG